MRFSREDLEKLTVLDVEQELYDRLGSESVSMPRLKMELNLFKEEYLKQIEESERLAEEESRAKEEYLRKQSELEEIKKKETALFENKKLTNSVRWSRITNKRECLRLNGINVSNPEAWFRDLDMTDEEVGLLLKKLENSDYDINRRIQLEEEQREINNLRIVRNDFLYKTDWTQSVADSDLTPNEKKNYRLYRKYLKNLPKLIENKQVLDFNVMTFDEWYDNRPIFEGSDSI